MPVTKTAKRALRSSDRKKDVNTQIATRLEVALRMAKKDSTVKNIIKAMSLADITAKKKVIHKKKADRIKSQLSKLLPSKKSK